MQEIKISQAAADAIKDKMYACRFPFRGGEVVHLCIMSSYVNSLVVDNWIDVKNELPKTKEWVHFVAGNVTWEGRRQGSDWYTRQGTHFRTHQISYWMPISLPAPPKDNMVLEVHTTFSCRFIHNCDCIEKDMKDPEEVGYPPYHDECTCFVVEKPEE